MVLWESGSFSLLNSQYINSSSSLATPRSSSPSPTTTTSAQIPCARCFATSMMWPRSASAIIVTAMMGKWHLKISAISFVLWSRLDTCAGVISRDSICGRHFRYFNCGFRSKDMPVYSYRGHLIKQHLLNVHSNWSTLISVCDSFCPIF